MTVKVMIFTKNEAQVIAGLIAETRASLQDIDHEIYLIDDSSDGTPRLAQQLGCTVIDNGGEGLGAAYQKALKQACGSFFSYLVTMDGDGQADPREIPFFLKEAQDNSADLVLGSRFLKKGLVKYSYPKVNRLGVFMLSRFLSFECRMKITDSHGGLRVHSPRCAKVIEIRGSHTYVQESIIDASQKKLKIVEIPSLWRERSHGKSRVVASILFYIRKVLPILLRRGTRVQRWGSVIVLGGVAWVLIGGLDVLSVFTP